MREPITLTAADFEVPWDDDHTFQFIENESGTVMAFGHRDPAELVAEVLTYDRINAGQSAEAHDPSEVKHLWATAESDPDEDEWWMTWAGVTEETPGAFPTSVIWR